MSGMSVEASGSNVSSRDNSIDVGSDRGLGLDDMGLKDYLIISEAGRQAAKALGDGHEQILLVWFLRLVQRIRAN